MLHICKAWKVTEGQKVLTMKKNQVHATSLHFECHFNRRNNLQLKKSKCLTTAEKYWGKNNAGKKRYTKAESTNQRWEKKVKEEKGRDPIKEKHFGKLEQLSIIIYPLIAPS
jgi:hypothetical protein